MSDILDQAVAALNEKLAGADFDGSAKFELEGTGARRYGHGDETRLRSRLIVFLCKSTASSRAKEFRWT